MARLSNEAATLVTAANMIRKRGKEGDNGKHESNHKKDDKDKNGSGSIKPSVRILEYISLGRMRKNVCITEYIQSG